MDEPLKNCEYVLQDKLALLKEQHLASLQVWFWSCICFISLNYGTKREICSQTVHKQFFPSKQAKTLPEITFCLILPSQTSINQACWHLHQTREATRQQHKAYAPGFSTIFTKKSAYTQTNKMIFWTLQVLCKSPTRPGNLQALVTRGVFVRPRLWPLPFPKKHRPWEAVHWKYQASEPGSWRMKQLGPPLSATRH